MNSLATSLNQLKIRAGANIFDYHSLQELQRRPRYYGSKWSYEVAVCLGPYRSL